MPASLREDHRARLGDCLMTPWNNAHHRMSRFARVVEPKPGLVASARISQRCWRARCGQKMPNEATVSSSHRFDDDASVGCGDLVRFGFRQLLRTRMYRRLDR
jgi:hypothetical protein